MRTIVRLVALLAVVGVGLTCLYHTLGGWDGMFRTAAFVTIPLGKTGYELTYEVSRGLGMEEKVSVISHDSTVVASSGAIEVIGKPYDTGMALYLSDDGSYYIGQGAGFYRFVPATKQFEYACRIIEFLAYTDLGTSIAQTSVSESRKPVSADDRAPPLLGYLAPNQGGAVRNDPTLSDYYLRTRFLGKFGVIQGGASGSDVAFTSITPEPRMGLDGRCP